MKKNLLTLLLCSTTLLVKSQDATVEKSTFGIQTGILGIYVHNELKLSKKIVLRTEIGLDSELFGGSFYDKTGFLMTPVFTAEPRWYYNLGKRVSKSKNIAGNSGNFVSIKTSYNPDWFVISNYDNISVVNQFTIVPMWGIRRNIGNHFTYETGIGIGYRYYFAESAGYLEDESEGVLNLHLRVGYRF